MKDSELFSLFKQSNSNGYSHYSKPLWAYAIYKNKKLNLIDGSVSEEGFLFLKEKLSSLKIKDDLSEPLVCHLYYELGYIFEELKPEPSEDQLLAIMIQYSQQETVEIKKIKEEIVCKQSHGITLDEYSEKFKLIQEHLRDGDCYQTNLTGQFKFNYSNKTKLDFIHKILGNDFAGEYAHATYIKKLDKMILSNSPESLFKVEGDLITTRPIKGTLSYSGDKDEAWKELSLSEKDEAELSMITDLLRNDLTRIELIPSRVTHKKSPLFVPGLVHQYSKVVVPYSKELSFYRLIESLFPGGSITGAPKKRVMEIIREVENYNRAVYCGSTLLIHNKTKSCSINIRTAEFDLSGNSFDYGSGGAVTLLSKTNNEYEEILDKLKSFLSLLS